MASCFLYNRRALISLIGGAAAAWPLAARAQQPAKLPTIGFLGAATPLAWSQWVAALVQRLHELGWIEGRTVAIEYRWAEGRDERYTEIAAEFVRLKVDVIVTSGAAVIAAKRATSVIPIVFAVAVDPVGSGMVASLARPGGNVTGLSVQQTETGSKRLELLREVLPGLRRLAIMANVGYPAAVLESGEVQAAARKLGIEVDMLEIRRAEDVAPAFEARKGRSAGTLCLWRPAGERQPRSHQHLGASRATTDDVCCSLRGSDRAHVLWTKHPGPVAALWRLCRQDFARRKAGRYPGRAADQVRAGHQSDDGQGAWPQNPGVVPAARR
jgi:ABC transporter substrate binding protein